MNNDDFLIGTEENENKDGLGDLGDMGSWCSDHPILTFLLVGSALTAVVNIVQSVTKK
ncbi:MAG: hypothetical protein IJ150_03725 [Bacteroidales bacterium]|nr:hypothetical protein [Bacteroidales bacterium]